MLNSIIGIAKRAGEMISQRGDFTVKEKGSASNYVSTVDVAVEEFLKRELLGVMPEAVFLGEEEGGEVGDAEYVFIVDPIDGTANFVHNIGISSVSIALMKNKNRI